MANQARPEIPGHILPALDPSLPLILNLPPQPWHINRLAQIPGEGPDPFWIEREFAAAGLAFQTIDPYRRPWNPAAGMHNAYEGIDPVRSLQVLLTRRKAAVVLTGSDSPAAILLALRRLTFFRPPIVIWEVPWSPGWKFRERLSQFTIPRADRAVVVGSSQIEMIREIYGSKARPVFRPLFTDVDFFSPQPSTGNEPPYILSVGFDKGRDYDLLVRASKDLAVKVKIKAGRHPVSFDRAAHPNVELIEKHLTYIELRALYAGAAAVVISTKNTPNACGVTSLMEALAMGRPTIVSNNPALRDYLPPRDAAAIVPIGDEAVLRTAIVDLANDPAKAQALGQRGRAFAAEHFHPRPNMKHAADILWDVIEEAGTATRPR